MTPDPASPDPFDGAISTVEDFDAAIDELLVAALENDVDLTGSWVARTASGTPDFEVQITELATDRS